MKYDNIVDGIFRERPNRFIAYVDIAGKREKVHVKNTGRCKELLQEGAQVFLEKSDNPGRSTAYDLVAVNKNGRLINMDSQAPNRAVEEWLKKGILFPDLSFLRPETTFGNSRFDFYAKAGDKEIFLEVKGVTLEDENIVYFPDAPSERAVKHVEELIQAKQQGYEAYLLFVVQMKDVRCFMPNADTQPEFAEALARAQKEGVHILAYDCIIKKDSMEIGEKVKVFIKNFKNHYFDIPKPLLKWYDESRRFLPWREDPTPYHVWVSEIMLQQTRVEAVKPYYERFMKALPDIKSLAEAEEERLLKLWEGLGYYNRVRNLQKAAIRICEEYGGEMPSDYDSLLALSGIGSYTAGAIASIAFGKKVPAVDGNVLRVLSRISMLEEDILLPKVKKQMEEELLEVMPDRPGDFNQAMMEIGAMVCVPGGKPHCTECPLQDICKAHKEGCETEYPKKGIKKARSIEKKTVFLVQDEGRTALHKRPDKGLLASLYEFPNIEGYLTASKVKTYFSERGLHILRIVPLPDAKHIFSHKEWHMRGFLVKVDELSKRDEVFEKEKWILAGTNEVEDKYPIPSAFSAYTDYLYYGTEGFSGTKNGRKV